MKLLNTGTFIIFKSDKNGRYYWNLVAPNIDPQTGKNAVILRSSESDGFTHAEEAKDNATTTSLVIQEKKNQCIQKFESQDSGVDQPFFFRVMDGEQQLGVSEGYETQQNRTKGVKSVMTHGETRNIIVT